MEEEWLPVAGYDDKYEVSSHGRVRSNKGKSSKFLSGVPHGRPGNQYLTVRLYDGRGGWVDHRIHRLVLTTFVGPPTPDASNALHGDDDYRNNRLDNLRWGTLSNNSDDMVLNGTHPQARKTACPLNHLLIGPNVPPSLARRGYRGCLACQQAMSAHLQDELRRAAGRPRRGYYRGRDGFTRRSGETWQDEAHRRYAHIMRNQVGGA